MATEKTQYYVGIANKFNLTFDAKYTFKVSARNSIGNSNLSSSVTFKTDKPTASDTQVLINPPPRKVEPPPKKPIDYECRFYEKRD